MRRTPPPRPPYASSIKRALGFKAGSLKLKRFHSHAQDEEAAVFDAFRGFFEDEHIKKVWHNYSFDRHVMYHHVRPS